MLGERFYFGLAGSETLEDTLGLPFSSELAAFRSAQTLAKEIAVVRPRLRGTTCVVVTRKRSVDAFYVSIDPAATATMPPSTQTEYSVDPMRDHPHESPSSAELGAPTVCRTDELPYFELVNGKINSKHVRETRRRTIADRI